MGKVKNILFIMCDQLRADHLSCAGHPHLKTPAIDSLAARGVLFPRAYVQSGVCGPSRMSYYTGRYVFSHGATWNRVPLSLREKTIGDYLRPAGIRVALAGKTHVLPDLDGLERYGIEGGSAIAALMRAGRFEELDRYDGHSPPGEESGYAAYLRAQGYNSDDPWSDYVISADGPDGPVSGWQMRNVHLPARVAEEHSETAYMTREAMRFVEDMGDKPWFLHLSYVKPHWPYMAPAPYHKMYGAKDCLPLNRDERELVDQHPVLAAYRQHEESQSFQRADAPDIVRPAYMGLIKQLDDWLGRLFDHLKKLGRFDDTLILFTSPTMATSWATIGWAKRRCSTKRHSACPSSSTIPIPPPMPRAARSTSASSKRSMSCRPVSRRWSSPPTITSSKAARCCPCCAAARSSPGATRCSPSSTIPSARRARS